MLYKTLFRIKHSDTTNLQKEKEAKDKKSIPALSWKGHQEYSYTKDGGFWN